MVCGLLWPDSLRALLWQEELTRSRRRVLTEPHKDLQLYCVDSMPTTERGQADGNQKVSLEHGAVSAPEAKGAL